VELEKVVAALPDDGRARFELRDRSGKVLIRSEWRP